MFSFPERNTLSLVSGFSGQDIAQFQDNKLLMLRAWEIWKFSLDNNFTYIGTSEESLDLGGITKYWTSSLAQQDKNGNKNFLKQHTVIIFSFICKQPRGQSLWPILLSDTVIFTKKL